MEIQIMSEVIEAEIIEAEIIEAEIIEAEFKAPVLQDIKYPIEKDDLKVLISEYEDIPEIDINDSDEIVSKQFEFVVTGHKKFVKARNSIEKVRKTLKAPALEYGKTVDSIAKEFQSIIKPIEDKLLFQRRVVEDNEARKQREAEEAEERRVEVIRHKILNVKNLPLQHLNSNSDELTRVLENLSIVTQDEYEEFYDEAVENQNFVISQLQIARSNRVLVENAQKIQDEKEQEAKRLKDEEDAKLQAERAELEREKAELQKQKDEFAALNRAKKEEIDREEAIKKADALQAKQEIENEERKQKEKENFKKFKHETINALCDVCLLVDETAEMVFDGVYGCHIPHLKFEV